VGNLGQRALTVGALITLSVFFVGCQSPGALMTPAAPPSTLPPSTIEVTATPTVSATPSVVPSNTPTATLVESQLALTPSLVDSELRLVKTYEFASEYFSYSPDGAMIGASDIETVKVYSATNGELLWEFAKPEAGLLEEGKIVFSADGSMLAAEINDGSHGDVYLWEWRTHRLLKRFEMPNLIIDFELSPDGKWLVVADHMNYLPYITLWNLETGQSKKLDVISVDLAFSPKQLLLASANFADRGEAAVRLWDLNADQVTDLFYQPEDLDVSYPAATSLAFSPDGRLLAVVINGQLRLWDLEAAQEIDWTLSKPFSDLIRVKWSSLGVIGVLDKRGKVILLGSDTGFVIGTTQINTIERYPSADLTFSPEGYSLLTGGIIQSLQLWEIPQE